MIAHDDAYYESRKPQPEYGPFKTFLKFIWNKEKRTVLDRTAKEWGQVLLFYLCFFSILVSIFSLQLWLSIRYMTRLGKPYFQHSSMMSGNFLQDNYPFLRAPLDFHNPGISFKPNIFSPASSPMIWINESNANSRPKRYVEALSEFFQEYERNSSNYDENCQSRKFRKYRDGKSREIRAGKPCFFDRKSLGVCGEPPYGYEKPFEPCVLLKFNKRLYSLPSYYNRSSVLPRKMPGSLKKIIRASKKFYVWVSCDGANSVDRDHAGKIEYIPTRGFPVEFFPFLGQPGYLSPIVALRLRNVTANRLITIECVLWAPNIDESSLDFQIIIDE